VKKSVESFSNTSRVWQLRTQAVIICAPPMELIHAMSVTEDAEQPGAGSSDATARGLVPDFHDLLKAKSMAFANPSRFFFRAHTMNQRDGHRNAAPQCSRVIKTKPRALGTSTSRFTTRPVVFRGDSTPAG